MSSLTFLHLLLFECYSATVADGLHHVADISSRSRLRYACSMVKTHHHRWLGLAHCCRKGVEQSTTVDNVFAVSASVPKSAEDGIIQTIVRWRTSLNATEWTSQLWFGLIHLTSVSADDSRSQLRATPTHGNRFTALSLPWRSPIQVVTEVGVA